MKVLVAGATGSLRTARVAARARPGHEVTPLRRLLRPPLARHRRRAPGGDPQAQVPGRRRRRAGVWSSSSTSRTPEMDAAVVEHGRRGIYDIVR